VSESSDEERDWRDPDALALEPAMFPAERWSWHGPQTTVTGPAWGGSLEVVDLHLRTSRYLPSPESYEGALLFLETSEEMPSASYVYRVLMCMGERGLLQRFAGVVWGRPKASSPMQATGPDEKARYVEAQREAVLKAVGEYHSGAPLAFVMVDIHGRQVDFHPVTFDAHGGGIYEMEDGKKWVYPAQGFTGQGSVDETSVRCLSPEVQVLVHAGYELTEKDYRELYLLREHFGGEPPTALLADVLAAARQC
jgi:hypothetical protein